MIAEIDEEINPISEEDLNLIAELKKQAQQLTKEANEALKAYQLIHERLTKTQELLLVMSSESPLKGTDKLQESSFGEETIKSLCLMVLRDAGKKMKLNAIYEAVNKLKPAARNTVWIALSQLYHKDQIIGKEGKGFYFFKQK